MKLATERYELILAAVRTQGSVRLSELVERLGVTPVTVRRDVTALADRGLVVRVHGGVTLPRRPAADGAAAGPRSSYGPLATRTLIGMVAPSVEYYWPQIIQGAQAAAATAGGQLVLRASSYDPVDDRRQVTRLLERGVQTLLVAPSTGGRAGADLLRWLGSLSVPVVLVERVPPLELPTLALDAAFTAHALGAGLAVRHLVTLGYPEVGLVTSRHSPTSKSVRSGWASTVAALELPATLDVDVPVYGTPGWTDEYDRVVERCRRAGIRALFVHSDHEAIGIVERARDGGLTVPDELAVVSYDNEVAAACDPPLTAVGPPKHRLGALAVELALARIADTAERPVHRVELWPTLVVRESCGAQSRDGGRAAATARGR